MSDGSDDTDVVIANVAKHIKAEVDNTEIHLDKHHIHISHISKDSCSKLLQTPKHKGDMCYFGPVLL